MPSWRTASHQRIHFADRPVGQRLVLEDVCIGLYVEPGEPPPAPTQPRQRARQSSAGRNADGRRKQEQTADRGVQQRLVDAQRRAGGKAEGVHTFDTCLQQLEQVLVGPHPVLPANLEQITGAAPVPRQQHAQDVKALALEEARHITQRKGRIRQTVRHEYPAGRAMRIFGLQQERAVALDDPAVLAAAEIGASLLDPPPRSVEVGTD